MKKRKWAITAAVLLLLIVGGVWALWGRTDPRVEKIKQMQAELFKENKRPDRAKMEEIHKAMQDLSPEQRHQLMEQGRAYFERRMDERVKAYFALPKDQRTAFLDKQIKEMEDHRKAMEANRSQGSSGPGGPGGPGGSPPDGGGPPPGGPPPSGAQPGGPPGNNPDARLQRRNQRLDSSSPEQRAMRSAYFSDLQQRRSELGLPPITRPSRPPAR